MQRAGGTRRRPVFERHRIHVKPSGPAAWHPRLGNVKIGYEISFNRYFHRPQPMRTLNEIRADILTLERETEGLLGDLMGGQPRESASNPAVQRDQPANEAS